ncbi:unnamed protein product [Amoebophrya sp. A120]|nr:unnamed protein product [Amoebophrya sp. A120]|eukprot:GSA120T00017609001.1
MTEFLGGLGLGDDGGGVDTTADPLPPALQAIPGRKQKYKQALTRVTHGLPSKCASQSGKGTNTCDVMGQTISHRFKFRPGEDFFFLGARPGEYGKPPMISPAVAGSPSAAIVPMPGAQDPSMMMQSAGAYAAESKRAALYSNEMLHLARHLYRSFLQKAKQNYGWHPKVTGYIGADSFPLY